MYFSLTSSANVLMIGTLLAGGQALTAKPVVALGISLLASLANMLVIEPLATGLMFQRCAAAAGRPASLCRPLAAGGEGATWAQPRPVPHPLPCPPA
jgi:hypothetical protein